MVCNCRCWFAKTTEDKCKCSCEGENHGKGHPPEDEEKIPEDPVKRMTYENNIYRLCEYSFVPYPHEEKNPKFALGADVYAHIPWKKAKKYKDRNHALAIWQDIASKEWVVRKEYREANIRSFALGTIISNNTLDEYEEIYRGYNFQEALDMCTIMGHKYWGSKTEWKACDHGKYMSFCCKPKKVEEKDLTWEDILVEIDELNLKEE